MKPTVHAMLPPFTGHTAQGLSFTNASAACQLLSMGLACISQLWLTCENAACSHCLVMCRGCRSSCRSFARRARSSEGLKRQRLQSEPPCKGHLWCMLLCWLRVFCCNKIAEAEAVVSVNEKKWLVMHVHV
jgi:hypothetical protein